MFRKDQKRRNKNEKNNFQKKSKHKHLNKKRSEYLFVLKFRKMVKRREKIPHIFEYFFPTGTLNIFLLFRKKITKKTEKVQRKSQETIKKSENDQKQSEKVQTKSEKDQKIRKSSKKKSEKVHKKSKKFKKKNRKKTNKKCHEKVQ